MEGHDGAASDVVPCRHTASRELIARTKGSLQALPQLAPELIDDLGITPEEWPALLRSAVESMRGTASATTKNKSQFTIAILDHCLERGLITSWEVTGSSRRDDYRVVLDDGTRVAIEAKGCPDGNNTTIWDRPSWADEFIVWSQCPDSLVNHPGQGVWSGLATRLLPKVAAEKEVVDAFVFWDARCGSEERICPKNFGQYGIRAAATDIANQPGKTDWIPPPCIYLMPRSAPTLLGNPEPVLHTLSTNRFATMLLKAFNVPREQMFGYVHDASVQMRGGPKGTQLKITVVSRCHSDGTEKTRESTWKKLKRDR